MIHRKAVRALLLTDKESLLLLMKIENPDNGLEIWLTPGGGVEPGEDPESGLFREIEEETGLSVNGCVGPVWRRRHRFTFKGRQYDQSESFYLVATDYFEPDGLLNPARQEVEIFREFRWWTLEEIKASSEIFVPATLGDHLERLICSGCPDEVVDVGV